MEQAKNVSRYIKGVTSIDCIVLIKQSSFSLEIEIYSLIEQKKW
jgi:hypothetical protein